MNHSTLIFNFYIMNLKDYNDKFVLDFDFG